MRCFRTFLSSVVIILLTACSISDFPNVPDVPLPENEKNRKYIKVAEVESTGGDAAIFSISHVLEAKYWLQAALDANKKGALLNFKGDQDFKIIGATKGQDSENLSCLTVKLLVENRQQKEYEIVRYQESGLCDVEVKGGYISEGSTYRVTIMYYRSLVKSVVVKVLNRAIETKKEKNELNIYTIGSEVQFNLVSNKKNEDNRLEYKTNMNTSGFYNLKLKNEDGYANENTVLFLLNLDGIFFVKDSNQVVSFRGDKESKGLKYSVPSMERYVSTDDEKKTIYRQMLLNTTLNLSFEPLDAQEKIATNVCVPIEGTFKVDYNVSSASIPFKKGEGKINEVGVQMTKRHKNTPDEHLFAQWGDCFRASNLLPYLAEYHRLLIP